MAYELLWEPRGVHRRYTGVLTGPELLESLLALQGDERFDTLRFVINDFLGLEGHRVHTETMRRVVAVDVAAARTNSQVRVAVVTLDESVRALTRLYMADPRVPYPVSFFTEVEEARAWGRAFLTGG